MSKEKQVVAQPTAPQTKAITPAQALRQDLTRMTPEFKMALPANVTPEKFLRIVLNTVMATPAFLDCDRTSLYAAAMKCAADGLFPDGREAVMIPYGKTVQYQPMVYGISKRVRNSGEVALFCADLVFPSDSFRYGSNSEKGRFLEHQPELAGRGKMDTVVCAFALSRTTDGDVDFEVMSREEIEFTRSKSKAPNSPAWREWWGEMAKKTVMKRLAKRLPMDAESRERKMIERDDDDFEVKLKAPTKAEELRAKLLQGQTQIAMTEEDNATANAIEVESGPVKNQEPEIDPSGSFAKADE